MRAYLWALYSVPLVHMSVFVSKSQFCLLYFCDIGLQSRRVMPPGLSFFLRIALAVMGVLRFCIHFGIICSSSVKNVIGDLVGMALNL